MKSKITRAVLGFLMLHKTETFYVNELARKLELDPGNLHKKLIELESHKILRSERRGNMRLFGLNAEFPLLAEYERIVFATVGIEKHLRDALSEVKGIKTAFLFGSYAGKTMDAESDIDLMVIGVHDPLDLTRRIAQIQKKAGREINVINMTPEEFDSKRKSDPFLKSAIRKRKELLL